MRVSLCVSVTVYYHGAGRNYNSCTRRLVISHCDPDILPIEHSPPPNILFRKFPRKTQLSVRAHGLLLVLFVTSSFQQIFNVLLQIHVSNVPNRFLSVIIRVCDTSSASVLRTKDLTILFYVYVQLVYTLVLIICFVTKLERLKDQWRQKSRPISQFFIPCKIREGGENVGCLFVCCWWCLSFLLLFFVVCSLLFVVVVISFTYYTLLFISRAATQCFIFSVDKSDVTRGSLVTRVRGQLTDGACALRVANLCSTLIHSSPLCSKLAVPQILYIIDCWYLIGLHGLCVFFRVFMFIADMSESLKLCCLSFYYEPLIF